MTAQLRELADRLRSQLATVQRDADELGRDIRNATHQNETTVAALEHARRSISAALITAFDEMEKLDALIAAVPAAEPPPGGPP